MKSRKIPYRKVIQLVVGKANPNRMNGVNNVVHNLSSELNNSIMDVEVWGITDLSSKNTLDRSYKLKLFERFKFRIFPSFSLIKEIINQDKGCVIFHFHGAYIIEFVVFSFLLKIFGFSWVVTPHGGYSRNSLKKNGLIKKIYIKTFDKLYIQKAKLIHMLAPQERCDFECLFPNVPTICVPNGVHVNQKLIKSPIDIGARYFVYCGRLSQQKGLDRLLNGYLSYVQTGGSAKLVIIGDGEKRDFVEDYVNKKSLSDKVKLAGAVFGEDKDKLIIQAIAFVATSYYEGFPIALLEALALNKPLIVSRETNIGDLVEDNQLGICLDNCRAETVSSALFELQDNYIEYDFRPVEFIKRNYTWHHIAEQLDDEYRKLILD